MEAAEKSAEEAQAQPELDGRIDYICAKHSITRDMIYKNRIIGI
jgi:hypothetical protein